MYNTKTNTFTHKYIEIKRSLKYKENNSLKIRSPVCIICPSHFCSSRNAKKSNESKISFVYEDLLLKGNLPNYAYSTNKTYKLAEAI
jgi:hypothetical protein